MLCVWLLPLLLLRAAPADAVAAPLTYENTDPMTGRPVRCDACPPGTFLRAPCSSDRQSECAPCPAGSFTELWNYIGRCLRCGVCGHNQVLRRACTADSDCQCECQQGFYYNTQHDMCVRHSQCAPGQGVLSTGTADKDTECQVCSDGTYSDVSSAHLTCTQHKNCTHAGLRTVLRGATWHDSVCASSHTVHDGAYYLKEIVPAFFAHHTMHPKRLRRVVHMLPSENGAKQAGTSQLRVSELHARINTWLSAATAAEIRQLPAILDKTGAYIPSERLQNKLDSIDKTLMKRHSLGMEKADLPLF